MSVFMKTVLEISIGILAVGICIIFVRAIKGPRFTDRIVAINMIGTMTTAIICLLATYLNTVSLIDVSLVYTLLSFLAVVIICHVVSLHHKGRELFLKRRGTEAEEK